MRVAYIPFSFNNSECVPLSFTWPSFTTHIKSAFWAEESRLDMINVVHLRTLRIFSIASRTSLSPWVSIELVTSSSSRIGASLKNARAIAILFFWSAERWAPHLPIWVLYWSGNAVMKPCALAKMAAWMIFSSWPRTSTPYAIFSLIDPLNKMGSWSTTANWDRNLWGFSNLISTPSMEMWPLDGS